MEKKVADLMCDGKSCPSVTVAGRLINVTAKPDGIGARNCFSFFERQIIDFSYFKIEVRK